MGLNSKSVPCCQSWAKAQEDETDNEGFGPLVEWWSQEDVDFYRRYLDATLVKPGWRMGRGLPNISRCPWCGAKVPDGPAVQP